MTYEIRAYSFRPAKRTKFVARIAEKFSLWFVLPLWKNREKTVVENIGYYFKREMRYDLAPYSAESRSYHNFAYLIAEHQGIHCRDPKANIYHAIGAIGITCDDAEPHILEWAWLHPYVRRRGIMKCAWSLLEKRHPEFNLRSPLSNSMEAFVKGVDPLGKHRLV